MAAPMKLARESPSGTKPAVPRLPRIRHETATKRRGTGVYLASVVACVTLTMLKVWRRQTSAL